MSDDMLYSASWMLTILFSLGMLHPAQHPCIRTAIRVFFLLKAPLSKSCNIAAILKPLSGDMRLVTVRISLCVVVCGR
ncbi:hypothetical protein B0H14DRAFT_2805088 [Mycena olivaceomarginata]|nr:hypothetical protein B0H14DRAFT_2805088 [Mycena olivaceomarginata]